MTRTEYEANFELATAFANKQMGMTLRQIKDTVDSRAERGELRSQHTELFHKYWAENFSPIPEGWYYGTAEV
jgi:hypothetical protein